MGVPDPASSSPKARAVRKWIGIAVVVAAVLLLGRKVGGEIPRFAAWVDGLGAIGPLVFIAGYVVAVVAFVPASLLTLAAGAIFGIARGVLYVFCAAVLGSGAAFLLARHVARSAIERRLAGNGSFDAIDGAVAAQGRRIVFLLRLSPAFPFTLLNYALGLTRVRFADYMVASVGMLPGTLLYVYYGKLAGDVAALAGGATVEKGPEYYGVLTLGLVATVAVTALVTRTARRALADATMETTGVPGPARLREARKTTTDCGNADHSEVTPLDRHNAALLGNVRPADWKNPDPAPIYDLVVIGAGSGGLISAAVGSGLGARVALVEKNLMGGDCLNFGCVPSKTVIRQSRRISDARAVLGDAAFDEAALDREFAAAMEEMRRVRAVISREDSARRYRDELGVDVFHGAARFTSASTVEVAGTTLRFRKAVVASGARADVPPVAGLREAGFLTNETVFNLTARPRGLVVLGAGPIGCELAQAMQRLGCDVTLVDRSAQILPREDADAAAIVQHRLQRDGVRILLGVEVSGVEQGADGKVVRWHRRDDGGEVTCDEVLVAAGRKPNVEGLELDVAGIESSQRGIRVDDRLRTTNPRVFAVGDCCLRWQFTHAADATAKIAVQNALFFGRKTVSSLTMPWCTFTEPEIAHVGLYEHDARERGVEVDTFTVPMDKVNRAACDGDTEGFVRVHVKRGTDTVLGATIVASHAGEMISEVSLAIAGGLGLAKIASVIHPYPTQAEGIKAAANAYMRTKLTPLAKKVLRLLLRVQR